MSRLKFFSLVIIATIVAGAAVFYIRYHYGLKQLDAENFQPIIIPDPGPPTRPSSTPSTTPRSTLLLKVPFTSQAPTGNWDQTHNEDCEEADAVMTEQYFNGNTQADLSANLVEDEMAKLNTWEDQNFGYHLDTNISEVAQMLQKIYGLQTQIINNFTAQDLKNQLTQNHLVIISEDGQNLGNPNYKRPGPLHHMLLVRGYTPEGFITNDSGTRNGQNYFYTFTTIYNAAGDWDHATNNIDFNKKIAIAVWK